MGEITDYFRPPAFARINRHLAPETKDEPLPKEPSEVASSPLSDPPPSSRIELTLEDQEEPTTHVNTSLSQSISDGSLPSFKPEQSFQSAGSAPPPSSLGSFLASQRVVKDGKEVVISSDGEDTDSIGSLEDPDMLLEPRFKQKMNETRPAALDKAYLAKLAEPKRYQNSLDTLVHDAVDDNETEANVAKIRASLTRVQPNGNQAVSGADAGSKTKKRMHEGALTSALGESDDGNNFRRLLDAVRRTEALDQDRIWRFFDQVQTTPASPEFPRDLFSPESHLSALREPDSRVRAFQSGILEYASSLQQLPDRLLYWLFHSVPMEPRDELRKAYCRVFTQTSAQRVKELIRPDDIDGLFRQIGAKPQALDLTARVVEDSYERTPQNPQLKDRAVLLSIFDLLQDAADLFSNNTRERAIHILLRITLDTSLTADSLVRSELQRVLSALLESVPTANTEEMDRRICMTVYNTVEDPQFQSRMLQHILPTSTWVSLLRYRLAVAFLIRSPGPLTEPTETVLDLKRLTLFLMRDERFQEKLRKAKGEYDYAELIAIALLLEIVLNSTLYDLRYNETDTAKEFDDAIDKLAAQIKKIFSSIEDSGASHLKRMLAKETLEALHYRVMYSVRSKPPPKKTLFKPFGTEHGNGNIRNIFKSRIAINTTDEETSRSAEVTEPAMPIRGH